MFVTTTLQKYLVNYNIAQYGQQIVNNLDSSNSSMVWQQLQPFQPPAQQWQQRIKNKLSSLECCIIEASGP